MRWIGPVSTTALLLLIASACTDATSTSGSPTDGGAGADATPDAGAKDDPTDGGGDAGSSPNAADDAGDASSCTPPGPAPKVVFLNRAGGTYIAGASDSRTNETPLVSQGSVAQAWTVAEPAWQTLLACVNQKFAPFNISVIDSDPGNVEHLEVVFAQEAFPALASATSIAPLTCSPVPNAISFVSQTYAAANLTNGCAAVAANVGFSLGLEQVTSCPDALSYKQTECAGAAFTDAALSCGTTAAANCQCGAGTTQNSFVRLKAVTGPRCL